MTGKSQQELEQPAKVYQLDAVDAKVNDVLTKLDTVINQTRGVVTAEQLVTTRKEILEEVSKKIEASEKSINLKYGPMKSNLTWFTRLVISQGVVILGGIVVAAIAFFSPKG